MSSHTIEDLTSCILDYQANVVRATYRRKITMVEPDVVSEHAEILARIWADSKVGETESRNGIRKWRQIGFDSEDITQEFHEVGVLGLQCLVCHTIILFLPINNSTNVGCIRPKGSRLFLKGGPRTTEQT